MGGVGSGAKPREYPAEVVALVCGMYRDGKTVAEIRKLAPKGYRVQTILERHLPERRSQSKRDQRGELNHMWRGDEANYKALHLRVQSARGKPSLCSACESTDGKFEWANLTGNYQNINDYIRLCISCHRRFDADRRKKTGRSTRPQGVMHHV